ncbi:MAG: drug/metabolite transporter (DMT)-like permease [Crocinitomix sp.]|jgi:drug/metabolite transporter (DMT)-like permease
MLQITRHCHGFFMGGTLKHYLILNLTVLVWGFTGVLGKEMDMASDKIVFFRMGIAFASLLLIGFFYKNKGGVTPKQLAMLLGTGVVVGLHWFTFFQAIKLSTVSVGVVCLASATLFTAILEPLIFKRQWLLSEFILSLATICGIAMVIGFEPQYILGIITGLTSAFLAALFGVLNGKFIKTMPTFQITKYEMLGGFITMALILAGTNSLDDNLFVISNNEWVILLILGLVCTTAAFMITVWLMKFLSPFTISMGLNTEPIYAILIALMLGYMRGESTENMSVGFYVGTCIIIGGIFINGYVKMKKSSV